MGLIVSRRMALRLGFGAVMGTVFGGAAVSCASMRDEADGDRADPDEFHVPEVVRSADGVLAVSLTSVVASVDMGAERPVTTYTYDGMVPGRTWEVQAGDTLRIDLVNDLPELDVSHEDMGAFDMSRPHEWTTTNLHTHGLHVSPQGNGDNVFLSVAPGGTQRYEIPIPSHHPGGIHWYHPHRHGAVCQQVRAGMAGMIIVRGEIDQVPEVRAAKEQVMVLQAIELGDDFQLAEPIPYPTTEQSFFPRTQILYTVNGRLTPKITMYPGEVQRWRLVNAAEGKYMSLALEGHALNVLAWDGLTLAEPEPSDVALLSAGNRVELLVKAGAPGTYNLVLTPGSSQHPDIPGMPHSPNDPGGSTEEHSPHEPPPMSTGELEVRPILTLKVAGEGPEMNLPSTLPAYDPPMPPIARTREVRYTVEREPGNEFETFGINGFPYSPEREPYQPRLGTAEEWTIVNATDPKLARHAHVLHIHVNPFKITKINGEALDKPLWRDTWVLTGGTGDSFTFETHFADFTGQFVQHCHILSHEDLGMMEAVEVIE
ncbi:multicopper oxidase family protein [Hoyosella altamirensis]|uniref:FtsP/CotA-like multicopper oxidase with cupredoxin domain n=1 Tax=Hoyosella altamirensis TaxID=616997 RepID=A0A839RJY4_9ACTN|nr:multicopper oxidase domain-containing protein [Hoyosella altamirensis]MBB3036717.1 FtsP/CotA-like multicopper oxidase with cupredoxin domain [Hoyosella altamirensis]